MFASATANDQYFHFSVPEVSHSCEHHGQPVLIGRCDYLIVTHRPTGLNNRRNSVLRRAINAIAEREESVLSHDRTFDAQTFVPSLDRSNFCRVHATHLSCTNADRHAIFAKYNGVGLYKLGHFPRK